MLICQLLISNGCGNWNDPSVMFPLTSFAVSLGSHNKMGIPHSTNALAPQACRAQCEFHAMPIK